jgi:hypothetical protein
VLHALVIPMDTEARAMLLDMGLVLFR